jgi:hypothetical protein
MEELLYFKIPAILCAAGQVLYILLDMRKRRDLSRAERWFYGYMTVYPPPLGAAIYFLIVGRAEKSAKAMRFRLFVSRQINRWNDTPPIAGALSGAVIFAIVYAGILIAALVTSLL